MHKFVLLSKNHWLWASLLGILNIGLLFFLFLVRQSFLWPYLTWLVFFQIIILMHHIPELSKNILQFFSTFFNFFSTFFNFFQLFCQLFSPFFLPTFYSDQMSEGSEVSKVTLCVKILKWHPLTHPLSDQGKV